MACETYSPDVNGAAVFARRLAEGLAYRGHETHVISPSPLGHSYQEDLAGVRLHRVPSYKYPWHATFHIADFRKVSSAVAGIMRDVRPDIVHLQAHLVVGRRVSSESQTLGIPVVATNHFMPENLRSYSPMPLPEHVYRAAAALAWRDLGNVLQRADFITAPTPYAVDLLRRKTGIERAQAISCGVDIEAYRPTGQTGHHPVPTVLFVGRLDREKHVDDIIDALPMLDAATRLRIVGQGSTEGALRRHAVSRGVDTRIDFLGQLSDDEVRDEYAQADVFCMPGTAELQSIATLEAMASGLPVVAANAHALPLLVTPGRNGELFRPGDINGLAMGLQKVLTDADRARAYGVASLNRVRTHDIKNTLNAFESLYEEAATGSEIRRST